MEAPVFDFDDVFDEDYLHFYTPLMDGGQAERDAALAADLLRLEPGHRVLDLGCGHGRISVELARRGYEVVGMDRSRLFLERAVVTTRHSGIDVQWVWGDMRALPFPRVFDGVVCWFTSFGYFGDDENRRVLHEAARVLRPGGVLVLDVQNREALSLGDLPETRLTACDGEMSDRRRYDAETGRYVATRTVLRGGRTRSMQYSVRLFTYPELRDWLWAAGFCDVHVTDEDGGHYRVGEARRMIVTATRADPAGDR